MSEITFDYAQIGAVKLHYAIAGRGREKLVVLLHGFPEFWYSWRKQLAALSDEYTVVAPDMRGYNLSDKPENVEDYRLDKLADDICGLIGHLGYEKAAVVGHDWGAIVAWELAQNRSEYVSKVCALQVPPFAVWKRNLSLKQTLASWYMFFFQIPFLPEWFLSRSDYAGLTGILLKLSAAPGVFSKADIAAYKKSWREPASIAPLINYYRADVLKKFFLNNASRAKIRVPTLFIYGEKDLAVLPESVKGVSEAIDAPFSEIRIPDAGHWVQQEASEIVTDSLREFLAEK
ncbi:MAG: alpha/beta hydrolase [Pyrinomonadaceae bacterium]|nr:alpha/beta hydrolase [Pyrinomonadaceae bacterium]